MLKKMEDGLIQGTSQLQVILIMSRQNPTKCPLMDGNMQKETDLEK